jgi:nucleoside-diphosphate-sugar epimerase
MKSPPMVINNTMSGPIQTEVELDELLTRPRPELIAFVKRLHSPLLVLGAGGKMGPTLAVLARRAADAAGHPLEIIAVSRFSDASSRQWLEARGIQTLSLDLLNRDDVARLPDSANIIYLVGLKFGTANDPALTWAINTVVPAHIAQRFPRAAIVALSTGNVYPFVPAPGPGSREFDPLTPLGE